MRSNFSSLIAAANAFAVLKCVESYEGIVFQMDGAVGAFGQGLAQHLL